MFLEFAFYYIIIIGSGTYTELVKLGQTGALPGQTVVAPPFWYKQGFKYYGKIYSHTNTDQKEKDMTDAITKAAEDSIPNKTVSIRQMIRRR